MNEEIRSLLALLVMGGILLTIKMSGFSANQRRKIRQGYEEARIDENGNVFLTVKNKFLGFDRSNEYRLKYIKAESSNLEKIKNFMNGKMKDMKYILVPVKPNNIFKLKKEKMAIIFIRDTSQPFEKVPTMLLPRTEIQNIAVPLIKMGLAEARPEDFTSFADQLAARKLKKEEGIIIPEVEKEAEDGRKK